MPKRLRGVFAPVVIPFDADLQPDAGRFIQHCQWLVSNKVGLAVFGTNSEANSLSVGERIALLNDLLAAGVDPALMMPGTGCCALSDTVTLTKHAVESGCAGTLMLPPFFYKNLSDDALFRSFSEVIQRVGNARLRVYLYHIPPVAQVPITPGVIERLLKAYPGTIAGIKDSSGDWSNTEMLLKNFQSDSFDVFCGSEVYLLQNMRGGGAGCITATGNVNPAMIHELFMNWQAADADAKQAQVTGVRRAFEMLPLIPAMKALIAWQRSDAQWAEVRPPLMSLTKGQFEPLRDKLGEIGYSMQL